MKQHISQTQIEELSQKARHRLLTWLAEKQYWANHTNPDKNDALRLSIGQMIEFLSDYHELWVQRDDRGTWSVLRTRTDDWGDIDKKLLFSSHDLCDALFEACKSILEKEMK